MKALVTGGGGFLCGAIVRLLRKRGDEVRSFSRGRYSELDALGVPQVGGDLADSQAVAAACEGCDVVFHVAAKAGIWGRYADYHRANVTGTENVVAACRKHGKHVGVGGLSTRPELAAEFIAMGARLLSTGTDIQFLSTAMAENARRVREIPVK